MYLKLNERYKENCSFVLLTSLDNDSQSRIKYYDRMVVQFNGRRKHLRIGPA